MARQITTAHPPKDKHGGENVAGIRSTAALDSATNKEPEEKHLVIPADVVLTGVVNVTSLEVYGSVEGDIRVERTLIVHSAARVKGDVTCDRLLIDLDCQLSGNFRFNNIIILSFGIKEIDKVESYYNIRSMNLTELISKLAQFLNISPENFSQFQEDVLKWKPRARAGRPNQSRETFEALKGVNFSAMEILTPDDLESANKLVWADRALRKIGEPPDEADRKQVLAAMSLLNKRKGTPKKPANPKRQKPKARPSP